MVVNQSTKWKTPAFFKLRFVFNLKHISETYITQDTNYETFPFLNWVVMDLFFLSKTGSKILHAITYINIVIVLTEAVCAITMDGTDSKFMYRGFIWLYHILCMISGIVAFAIKSRPSETDEKLRSMQWSLKLFKPHVKAAISRKAFVRSASLEILSVFLSFQLFVLIQWVDQCFIIIALNKHWKFLGHCMYAIEFVNLWVLGFLFLIIPYLEAHFVSKIEIQVFLLTEYVKDLAKTLNGENQVLDQTIHRHFKIIVDRYLDLKRISFDNTETIRTTTLALLIPAMIYIIVSLVILLQNHAPLPAFIICFAIPGAITFVIMRAGQRCEDQWENYYDEICNLPWYCWSIKMQKEYRLLAFGASKITKLWVFNETALNYELWVNVWKFLYGATNTFFSLRNN